MSINAEQVLIGGIAGGIAGDIYGAGKAKAKEASEGPMPQHSPYIEHEIMTATLGNIEHLLREAQDKACPPKFEVFQSVSSEANAGRINREGYKHVSLLTSAAFTVSCRIPILDVIVNFAMTAGWNALDLPDHTTIWSQDGTARNVMLYKGDDSLDIAGV